jgi:hypothetical protein
VPKAVIPALIAAYATFVAMVAVALRRPAPRPHGRPSGGGDGGAWRGVLGTIAGGYAAFLLIVLVFHVWLAGESDAFANAMWGGGFLIVATLGLSAADSILRSARRRRG